MKNGRILLDLQDNVAVMTLNHPEALNAFGVRLRADMSEALDVVEAGEARCLLITGAGRGFCSGANLNDADRPPRDRGAEERGEMQTDLQSWYNPTFIRLRDLKIPVVTAINGVAAGAGMSLAISADIRIAAKSATFIQAFARIGLVPDCGATFLLPRLIGMARAMELSLLAEALPADRALEWGMINRVVDDVDLMAEAMAVAKRLAQGPSSLGLIRKLYWDGLTSNYADQLEREARVQIAAGGSADHAEGIAAFREKRRASFSGR